MKTFTHILLALLLATSALTVSAATYSVQQVPNVQRQDSTQYVSNPDGILSPYTVAALNASLRLLRHNTTAEAIVVVVDDIEGGDIDDFATRLFELWGLGKDDKDNGLLIIVAKDIRRAAIRPGYGLEGVLPDITCGRILREQMFPHFREDDYDGGITEAVSTITTLLSDPEAAAEFRSKEEDYNAAHADDEAKEIFQAYLALCIYAALGMLVWLISLLYYNRGKDRHTKYVNIIKFKPFFLVASFLCMGIPLVVALAMMLILYRWRNTPRICKSCGVKMKKLDEVTDNQYLSPGQDLEERLGSVDYDVWLCPQCGETDIEAYINNSSLYRECPRCHVRAYALVNKRIIREATTRQEGLGVNEYHCSHCGYDHDDNFTIPKKEDPALVAGAIAGAAAASRGRGSFGGGSFGGFGGGGFGGGHTGGGGASGGW